MSEKDRHNAFVWEYFDIGISKTYKGVTDEVKYKDCAAVIKCTGGLTSGLLRHLKTKKISNETPSSTRSDVTSDTQSSSSTKHFRRDNSQATQHSFMNKKNIEEIVA